MNLPKKIATVALSLALLASAGLNVFLYQQWQKYYLLLNATGLDPLGLNSYPNSAEKTQQPVIVFYGDSRAESWPAPDTIKNATIVNRGIGGQTTAQVLGRFQQHVASLKPKIIVIQVGVNDLKAIPLFPEQKEAIIRNCETNIGQIVKNSLDTGAKVVVTTIFPLGTLPIERRPFWSDDVPIAIKDVNDYIKTLAGDRVIVLDSSQVLANSQGIVNPKYSRDFLHLNSEGYAALNKAITGILVP
ncbi:MAG: SGNH/GDSL hydrolase family protein [Oscillatoriales cyanobacterium]|nr:MAG: SGNH/GDSL hydrolase family protein [Oscillatoriales cyanobacterium]TAF43066.1 MAG: SGNH/GDSL hydrolase family protein [Oscillatoriales cyanobacterium]TAF65109.1 MAG: SGNH/GDSL hydrolase family protein [Oscillatoriales cyanobacterium]